MDYEKKYREALGWMQSVYLTMTGAVKEDAEHYFPELKESEESENENILKAIIYTVKNSGYKYCIGVSNEEMVSWLEKQGESTLIEEIKRKKEVLLSEKEKAHSISENLSLGGRIAMLEELLVFANEKQCEQKPADKVEPKFHKGQWITIKE